MGRHEDPSWAALCQNQIASLLRVAKAWRELGEYNHHDNPYIQTAVEHAKQADDMVKSLTDAEAKGLAILAKKVPQQEEPDLEIPDLQAKTSTKKRKPKPSKPQRMAAAAAALNGDSQQEQKSNEPILDASGLFAIDSNPMTPNEVAQIESRKRTSRDWDAESQRGPNAIPGLIAKRDAHPSKRQKQLHGAEQTQADERAHTFKQSVELRLKEKEDKRQQKANRKRKRESGDSAVGQEQNEDLAKHANPAMNPAKQRKKDLMDQLAAAREVDPTTSSAEIKAANTKKAKRAAKQMKSGYLADTEKPGPASSKPKKKRQKKAK